LKTGSVDPCGVPMKRRWATAERRPRNAIHLHALTLHELRKKFVSGKQKSAIFAIF
jgi:hypothetical protein